MEDNLLNDVHHTVVDDMPTTTRIGSSRRIDFIFATEGILSHVKAAGYRGLYEAIHSDHILLWVEFDFKSFFGSQLPSILTAQHRELSVQNTAMRLKFVGELKKIHKHQRFQERVMELKQKLLKEGATPALVKKYNDLDRELV